MKGLMKRSEPSPTFRRCVPFVLGLICAMLISGGAAGELSTNLQVITEMNPRNHMTAQMTYIDDEGNPTVPDDKGYATVRYS